MNDEEYQKFAEAKRKELYSIKYSIQQRLEVSLRDIKEIQTDLEEALEILKELEDEE